MSKAPADLYRHVDGLFPDTRTLIESADAVEHMLGTPGYQAVQKLIEAEIELIDQKLDRAPLREASEYAHAHGRRSALLAFSDAAQAILERSKQRVEADERNAEGETSVERQAA